MCVVLRRSRKPRENAEEWTGQEREREREETEHASKLRRKTEGEELNKRTNLEHEGTEDIVMSSTE